MRLWCAPCGSLSLVLNKSGSWTSTDRPGHPRSRPPIGQTSSGSAPPVNRGRPSRPPPHRPALSPTVPHTRPDPHIPRTSHDSNRRPATDSPALVRRPSDSLRPAHRSLLTTPRVSRPAPHLAPAGVRQRLPSLATASPRPHSRTLARRTALYRPHALPLRPSSAVSPAVIRRALAALSGSHVARLARCPCSLDRRFASELVSSHAPDTRQLDPPLSARPPFELSLTLRPCLGCASPDVDVETDARAAT